MSTLTWKCTFDGCGEVLEDMTVAGLQLQINGHNRHCHPIIPRDAVLPCTWQCGECGEVVSRRDEALLALAIVGHGRFRHAAPPVAKDLAEHDYVQDPNKVFIAMHGGMGADDVRFLRGVKIIW